MTRNASSAAGVDLWRGFTPFATQKRFLMSGAKYRLLSSGYGGGKSAVGSRESIRHALSHPGSCNLVARNIGTHLRDTTMRTFWREARRIGLVEGVHYAYNKQDREITWWNGSTTLFRHFEDVEALGSLELSTAFIDEGAEVDDDIYTALFPGRLRAHLPACTIGPEIQRRMDAGLPFDDLTCPCPQRAWVCTNPGGSGYLKAVTLGKQPSWEWFPVKPAENPFNGPDYYRDLRETMKKRGDVWFKRFYEGSWDAFEGQRFTMFERESHILPAPFRPASRYEVVEGWDFGHRETFVVWIAFEGAQEEPVVVFHELQVKEVDAPEDVANRVKRVRAEYGIQDRVRALGDPAGAAASQFSAIGPIAAYAALGIYIAPCREGKSPTARADLIAHMFNTRRRQPDRSWWPGLVIGPNCPALIDSITNLRWDAKSSREQFVKENDHGCVAEGSMVSTPTGPRAIESLSPGDEVLTRQGPRPVQIVARTQDRADCLTVTTSGGRTLSLTADHPVWVVGRGWVRSDALGYGDMIYAWSNPVTSSTTAGTDTAATPTPSSGAIGSTTGAEEDSDTCTGPSGRTPTDGPYPTATRFTTRTGTRSTTIPTTSSSSRPLSTGTPTSSRRSAGSDSPSTSTRSGTSRPTGTDPTRAASGTEPTAGQHGKVVSPAHTPAPGAAMNSSLSTSARVSATALSGARRRRDVPAGSMTRTAPARRAGAPSESTATTGPGRALDSVVAVCAGPRGVPVWNLLVDDVHEFYANGILVSNCDALGYGMMGVPPPRPEEKVSIGPLTPADAFRARPTAPEGWVDD